MFFRDLKQKCLSCGSVFRTVRDGMDPIGCSACVDLNPKGSGRSVDNLIFFAALSLQD